MHGRVKVKTDLQKQLEKKKEKEEKCRQYLALQEVVFGRRARREYDSESLATSAQLVSVNPDFYTVWNFRREIINHMKDQMKDTADSEAFEKILRNELQLTENCLKVNYKSYCVWHQRQWIIGNMTDPDLKNEISLCNQLLQLDERNFHCWDYRTFVSKLAKASEEEGLEFTLHKIQQNFSNFSSWYHRSCLFRSAVASDDGYDFSQQWKKEYDLVENAIFTDPTDQSAWFYHKWLVSTNYGHNILNAKQLGYENVVKINRVVFNTTHALLVVSLSRPLKHKPLISVVINNQMVTNSDWNSPNDVDSNVWFIHLDTIPITQFNGLTISPIPTFAVNSESVELLDIKVDDMNNTTEKVFVWERKSHNLDQQSTLEESYLKTLRELQKLEPNNKWVNLTLAWTEPNRVHVNSIFDQLIKLDPLRTNYYKDLKSKTTLNERMDSIQSMASVSLNKLNITALYDCNRLAHIQTLDLSDNQLLKLSKTFNHLLSLEVLILDSNNIYTIDADVKFNKLRVLSLNKNKIYELKSLTNLSPSKHLEKLLITENPISDALKDVPNSQLLLADNLQIISCTTGSDTCPSGNVNNSSELKVYYKLF